MITSLSGSFSGIIAYRNNTSTPFRGTFDSKSLEFDPFGQSGAVDALSNVDVANDVTAFLPLGGSFVGVPSGAVVPVQANFLNVTLDGDGYFILNDPDSGVNFYARNILMALTPGQSLSFGKYILQPQITLPSNTVNILMGADGVVSVMLDDGSTVTVGAIEVSIFNTPPTDLGGGIFEEGASPPQNGAPGTPGYGTLVQGFVEERNPARNDISDVVLRVEAVITSDDHPEMTFAVVYEAGSARLIGSTEAINSLRTDDHFASMFNTMLQNATGDSNLRVESL